MKALLYKDQLRYYAEMDIMTASYNRNKMEQVLVNEFERCGVSGEVFSLALMDIDGLKKINDTFGHAKGDETLKSFSNGINSRIRTMDWFGRWGGDEFLLLCPNTGIEEMEILLKEVYKSIIKDMGKVVPNSSFCYGCAEYRKGDYDNYQELLKRADKKLYKCKEGHRKNIDRR